MTLREPRRQGHGKANNDNLRPRWRLPEGYPDRRHHACQDKPTSPACSLQDIDITPAVDFRRLEEVIVILGQE